MKAEVNDLIILCNMMDSFEDFSADFYDLMQLSDELDTIKKIVKVNKGEKIFLTSKINRKIKEFCQKYKLEIEIINKYSNVDEFLKYNYVIMGIRDTTGYDNLKLFYQYFLDYRDELEQILSLLEKIKDLGIDGLELNEKEDFMATTYGVDTSFSLKHNFVYLENIEVVSNYDSNKIIYRTLGSCYKIIMGSEVTSPYHHNEIVVNNLLFDANRLPENLSKEVLFAEFNKFLNNEGERWKQAREFIDTSVSLSVATDDLLESFNEIDTIIRGLDSIENKDELLAILHKIRDGISELEAASLEFNNNAREDNPLVTKEKLADAKVKRLYRRFFNSAFE